MKKKMKKPDQDSMTVGAKTAQPTQSKHRRLEILAKQKHARTPDIFFQTGKRNRMESEEQADTLNVHMSTPFAENKCHRATRQMNA